MYYQDNIFKNFLDTFDFREYIERNFAVESYSGNALLISCPFHAERSASCAIYDNHFYCFGAGCNASGSSIDFLSKTLGISSTEVLRNKDLLLEYSARDNHSLVQSKVSMEPIDASCFAEFSHNLQKRPYKKKYLYNRHFDDKSIEDAQIGYYYKTSIFKNFFAPRYSLPVMDENRVIVSARYRIDPVYEKQWKKEPKYLGHPKRTSYLYNSFLTKEKENILIVGSELDAAFLYHRYRVFAVAPPGEGNFREGWAQLFSKKNVLIWLDYDIPGINGAIKIYNMLRYIAKPQIYQWRNEFRNKDDICDFVTQKGIIGVLDVLDEYNVKAYS